MFAGCGSNFLVVQDSVRNEAYLRYFVCGVALVIDDSSIGCLERRNRRDFAGTDGLELSTFIGITMKY